MDDTALGWVRPGLLGGQRERGVLMLSVAELERYEGTPEVLRESFVQGRMLLREVAAELLGTRPDSVVIVARCPDCGGPHGQPRVEHSTMRLSLSRCATAVVAVASRITAVGIDVEPDDVGPDRLAAIGILTGVESVLHWTAIEAVLKADGRGLRVDPARVLISRRPPGFRAWVADSGRSYRVTQPELHPGLVVSLAKESR